MVAVILSPIYILLILYILRWNLWWLSACSSIFRKKAFRIIYSFVFLFISLSLIIAFFIREPSLKWFFKHLSNYWLGTLLYIILTVVIGDIIRFILLHIKRVNKVKLHSRKTFIISGAIVTFCIVAVSTYGIIHARDLKTKKYEITIDKTCETGDMKVVLIADLHMGYSIGHSYIEKMARKINDMEPDLICIAGDIFDNEYDALDDPAAITAALKSMKSTYGTYACWGNHDISEKILAGFTFGSKKSLTDDDRMGSLLQDAGITLLNDETVCIDDSFYLIGRKDIARVRKIEHIRKSPEELTSGLDKSKPVIVLEHQPKQLSELSEAGVDAHLCGHTHNGQLFPGNLTIGLLWENPYGLEKKGSMYSIVTSGVGVWGPDMRVGTDSEIVEIQVSFRKD
ncbi:metallophosphoesterase [Lacrimispora sp. NSJ-141]|uniref:Metallophosphoesterase n=1 Tax=Lientehia hominis TaxID=2897778 RepID=A0AAP2RJI8_9FIRM|nr:metallophosphoesterase [Lientehia hominis]MCD2493006.1 metallophosphoesterase [Lientehia hominis]